MFPALGVGHTPSVRVSWPTPYPRRLQVTGMFNVTHADGGRPNSKVWWQTPCRRARDEECYPPNHRFEPCPFRAACVCVGAKQTIFRRQLAQDDIPAHAQILQTWRDRQYMPLPFIHLRRNRRLQNTRLFLQTCLLRKLAPPSRHSLAFGAHRHRLSPFARKKMSALARREISRREKSLFSAPDVSALG